MVDLESLIGTDLSVEEINQIIASLREKKKEVKRKDPEFKAKMREYQVRRRAYLALLEEKARAYGITVSEDEIEEYMRRKL